MEFLARSEHRLAVLQAVAEATHTRRELSETTGASQATLGRIIEDFDARSWLTQTEAGYTATATGRLIAAATDELLTTFETEQKLRDIVEYLPTETISFDLRRLDDATITVPTQTRPSAPLRRLLDRMRTADRLRAFSHTFNGRSLETVTKQVIDGTQTFDAVFGETAIDALATDDQLWERLTTLAAADDARLRVRPDGVAAAATVSDDTVTFLLRDENGVVQAAVESTDPAIRTWAVETFDRYLETAVPFEPSEYAPR